MKWLHTIMITFGLALGACGPEEDGEAVLESTASPSSSELDWRALGLPYAGEVVSFAPGPGSGHGAHKMPSVVLGPPQGLGESAGSLDVLSLGHGGEIVLGFEGGVIVDGEGADFVVFENAFWAGLDPAQVFAEPGEVSVSEDGQTWHTFGCQADPIEQGSYPGCAGWSPTLAYAAQEHPTLSASITGGDAFDLAALGVERARFVRIRDVSMAGQSPSAGFDLDAVGAIHLMR